jgi:protein tyrosine phosphatase (PTP) superfamily phosphohydrolase (DUF442 family)
MPHRSARSFLPAATVGLLLVAGCHQVDAVAAGRTVESPVVPPLAATKAVRMPGLHNVVSYAPGLMSGGVPEGEEGFQTLAALGIKTIVSVDGAKPDLTAAEQHGIRYVHLPISYDTVTPERQEQLAQAITSLDGPIYLHCHHGKHRSAAAMGSAVVLAGKLTPEQACERMHVSGTAPEYEGLWKAVRQARPLDAAELHADPASFPSFSVVTGMVATMAEIDMVYDLVKQSKAAGWKAPDDHPDLVAAKEARRLRDLFAQLQTDPDSTKLPADYHGQLEHAIATTRDLDAAVHAGDATKANALLDLLGKSCKQCHKAYRDN